MSNILFRFGGLFLAGLAVAQPVPSVWASAAGLRSVPPQEVGIDAWHLNQIDVVVAEGLSTARMPGCVVLVGRQNKIVLLRAYGLRRVLPTPVAMTADTVFDLASLTKPVATATSVMVLVDRGRVRLDERVATYLPEFGRNGKDEITVFQLLTHQSGLVPDNPLRDYADGPRKAWERICDLRPRAEPGTTFIYSDVGYIVLGELVRRVSGKGLGRFAHEHLFAPLGMTETGYLPGKPLRRRSAPTEQRDGRWITGEVHDPRAHRLGGVAGHAGLFATAADLARYASMMLGGGALGDARILSRDALAAMTKGYPVPGGLRGLGWDVRTGYSSNRGEAFSDTAFGHGGFTGTVLWIDPELDLFVVFLSSRLHPDGKGAVNALAGRVCTIAGAAAQLPALEARRRTAAAPSETPEPPDLNVLTGLDVLRRDGFERLKGRRVGLITNHTGLSRDGISTVHLLAHAPGVRLRKLFSPEHGVAGQLDQAVIGDSTHTGTGIEVISLYGKSRRPTREMLSGLDTLVFDIQDVGARFYTYISTMGEAMQAAAEHGLRFVVLDRPNPTGGLDVAGPVLDAGRETFTGFHRLPVRHGMTVGELAELFKADRGLDLDLHVVRMEGWRRRHFFDATGLRWVNPSPNMRSLTQALLYPGIGLLETTNLSVGRGTDTPFEVLGAPWINEMGLARHLNRARLPGVRFVPIRFTPDTSTYADEACGGVNVIITDREGFRPVRTGLEIARQLRHLYGGLWKAAAIDRLLRNRDALDDLLAGKTVTEIQWRGRDELDAFLQRRRTVLMYD